MLYSFTLASTSALSKGLGMKSSAPSLSTFMKAQLRRSREFAAPKADTLSAGALTLDRDSHTASLNGEELALTGREFDILALLMANPRRA